MSPAGSQSYTYLPLHKFKIAHNDCLHPTKAPKFGAYRASRMFFMRREIM